MVVGFGFYYILSMPITIGIDKLSVYEKIIKFGLSLSLLASVALSQDDTKHLLNLKKDPLVQ